MSEKPQGGPSQPKSVGLSRSGVGRVSGAVSRLLGVSRVQTTGRFLRRHLWTWPIIAAILLGGAGWWVHHAVEGAMHEQRATDLDVMVDASVNALRVWMGEQRINVELIAEDETVRNFAAQLLPLADGKPDVQQRLVQAVSKPAPAGG